MAYVVMAKAVMAYTGRWLWLPIEIDALDLYSYGLRSYGLCSHGLCSHGLCTYGLCTYGLCTYGIGHNYIRQVARHGAVNYTGHNYIGHNYTRQVARQFAA